MSFNRNIVLASLAARALRSLARRSSCPAASVRTQRPTGPCKRMTVPDVSAPAGATEVLTLTVNKSYMIEFDTDIDDVIIANEKIANVVARDRRRIAVMGVAPGESNMVFLDRSGRKVKCSRFP
jgi:pilus assembly protein CpaC